MADLGPATPQIAPTAWAGTSGKPGSHQQFSALAAKMATQS